MDRKRVEGLPVWMLTPKEEKEVFDAWKEQTWKYCDSYVKAFADCGKTAGYGVWFKCRKENNAMKACILERQQSRYVDEQRDLYIQKKIERLKNEKIEKK